MADTGSSDLSPLPEEMLKLILDSSHNLLHSPRLGQLLSYGRPPIHTPHYVAATSRGVVPHLSQDVFQKHTDIRAVYMGLEDFIEKSCRDAPILKTPTKEGESALRGFTALPSQCLSILGPRRVPRVNPSAQNTDSSIAICTSVGFRTLELSDYVDSTITLRPDISAVLPDLPAGEKMSKRRIEKSADRTQAWLRYTLSQEGAQTSPTFASIPPLEAEEQQLYLSDLSNDYLSSLSGLCIYDSATALVLQSQVSQLPALCISDPPNPQALLQAISLGVDLITVPFVTAASEQGFAFTFTFPPPATECQQKRPLGTDLFSPTHSTSVEPLAPSSFPTSNTSLNNPTKPETPCQCYTCTHHHRAYVHHLLFAREMLAWTLLQIHNFHVLSSFFSAVRESIRNGTFDSDRQAFEDHYAEEFGIEHDTSILAVAEANGNADVDSLGPPGTTKEGTKEVKHRGPRLRGYQIKSLGKGIDKKREKVWGRFNQKADQKLDQKDKDISKSPSRGTSTSDPGVENDQAGKIDEAKDLTSRSEELELTASDFEMLGLAERGEDIKKS